ncbi:MAG: hypothetical protein JRH09_15575 [Deltaproteobacteria bacterium]|nr:hypothetical protein [Deltaproteobacteria bacterium]
MAGSIAMTNNDRFTFGFYFQSLTRILGSPKQFFGELPEEMGFRNPFGFLVISSLFFTGASLTCIYESRILMAGILFINAIAMPFVTAGTAFLIMTMTMIKRVSFTRLFAVFAFASGVTMLASWIPLFVWITESWKWLLIAMGMVKACGLRWVQAILIVGCSIFIVLLFFWALAPVIFYVKGLLG